MPSGLSYAHIRLPARTWFPGLGWQLGRTPRTQTMQTPDTWERKGNLTSALRRIVFPCWARGSILPSRLQCWPLSMGHLT